MKRVYVIHAQWQNYDGHYWETTEIFESLSAAKGWIRGNSGDRDLRGTVICKGWQLEGK
jgi:hypothetical protein